ncbi:MAG: hypothetical protein ACT4OP_12495 [Actinomycetota bacterium]
MNHRNHDLELIAAYVSDGGDAPGAQAQIDECADCRQEYEHQLGVRNLLRQVSPAFMTDAERLTLHRSVLDRLGSERATDPRRRRQRRTRSAGGGFLWARVGAAAAGVVALASIGTFLASQPGSGGGATTTTAADVLMAADADPGQAPAAEEAGAQLAGPRTTAASTEMRSLPGGDLAAVRTEVERLLDRAQTGQTNVATDELHRPCADRLGQQQVVISEEAQLDGEPIIIFIVGGDPEAVTAVVYRISDCGLIELVE